MPKAGLHAATRRKTSRDVFKYLLTRARINNMGIDHHIPLIITVIEVRRLPSGSDNLTRLTCALGSRALKLPAPGGLTDAEAQV